MNHLPLAVNKSLNLFSMIRYNCGDKNLGISKETKES